MSSGLHASGSGLQGRPILFYFGAFATDTDEDRNGHGDKDGGGDRDRTGSGTSVVVGTETGMVPKTEA